MNWCNSLESEFQIFRIVPIDICCSHIILHLLTGCFIINSKSSFTIRIDNIWISRLWHGRARFATSNIDEKCICTRLGTEWRHTWNCYRAVIILLTSIQPVWILIIHFHRVEFSCRLIKLSGPAFSGVLGNVSSTVICLNPNSGVIWVNPNIMIIAMRSGNGFPGFTSIKRPKKP